MKKVYALLVCLCLLFTIAGALAQQQSANSSDLKSTAAKSVKKAKSKKNLKEQREAAEEREKETLPPLLSERLKRLSQTVQPNGGLSDAGGLAHQEFMHRAYPDK